MTPGQHLKSLDGLRGLAAMIVVVSHISNETGLLGAALGAGAGQIGVMIFFALSGFLMMHVTQGQALDGEAARRFYVHRASRVVPLFVAAASLAALTGALGSVGGFDLKVFALSGGGDLLRHLLLLDGDRVFWTIPVEIGFYLLFPLFWWLRGKGDALFACLAGLVFAQFLLRGVTVADGAQILNLSQFLHMFLVGILAHAAFAAGRALPRPNTVLLVAMAALLLCYPRVSNVLFGIQGSPWVRTELIVLVPVLILASIQAPLGQAVLGHPAARWVGKISYSLYLWHLFVLAYVQEATGWAQGAPLLYAAACIAGSLLVSWASFGLLENPARRVLNARFAERRPAAATAVA